MIRAALLALLLTSPVAGQRTPPPADDVAQIVNGSPIMPGSTSCAPNGMGHYVPTLDRARQIRDAVRLVMTTDIETGALTTSRTYQEWRVFVSLDWPTTFTARPTWVMAAVPPGYTANCYNDQGQPRWCGCASGIGTLPAVVDTSDPTRLEPLVAHETSNGFLGFLGRGDLWDGPYVSSVVSRVRTLVGGYAQSAMAVDAGDPPPATTGQHIGDGGLTHTEGDGQTGDLLAPAIPFYYLKSVGVGEDRTSATVADGAQPIPHGVLHVGEVRDGFKIHDSVVMLDGVQVVDLFARRNGADERLKNEPVDERLFPRVRAEAREPYLLVPVRVGLLPHQAHPEGQSAPIRANGRDWIAPDAAQVGDGVPPAGTLYGSPLFTLDVVYGTIACSHVSPPSKDSKVRLGWEGATSRRAASIVSNNSPRNKATAAALVGGWRSQ